MTPSRLVAVVDDEPSVRKALRRLLASAKFHVLAFASGREFLDSLPAQRPDCLVLDLHMPGMSGIDVQQELIRLGERLPIVVITALDEPESRAKCLASGAKAYLIKPIDDRTLLEAIDSAMRG